MEKSEKYKAKPKLEYSDNEAAISAAQNNVRDIRHRLESLLELIGQSKRLMENIRKQWELGNLEVTSPVREAMKELRDEYVAAVRNKDKLDKLYDEAYAAWRELLVIDAKENMEVTGGDNNLDKNKMN